MIAELPVALHNSVLSFVHEPMFQQSPFYNLLKPALLKSLSEHLVFAAVPKGECVVLEGFLGFRFFFIRHGLIEISSRDNGLLTVLRAGASFGEIAVLRRIPRTATAKALTNSELYYISTGRLKKLFLAFPEFKRMMWRMALMRLRQTEPHDDSMLISSSL
jgi:ATP-binding cassette subfamily B protein